MCVMVLVDREMAGLSHGPQRDRETEPSARRRVVETFGTLR
jgi:hypothetical protein